MRITSRNLNSIFNTSENLPVIGIFTFVICVAIYHSTISFQTSNSPISVTSNPQLHVQSHRCVCNMTDIQSKLKDYHRSMCNLQADLRGSNQSVVSYSLFGDPESDPNVLKRYFSSIESRAIRIAKVYPGWVMRVYHNLTHLQQESYLCNLKCTYSNVDLCNVNEIYNKLIGSHWIKSLNPRIWRFLVMLDPLVDRFLSRDIDSEIIPRETAAVRQWLRSNYTFHVMHDHPSHGGFMLAGLWGAKNEQRRNLIRRLGEAMVYSSQDGDYQTDQNRLDLIVWPFASFDVMAHDSYFCNTWIAQLANVVPVFPFPTKRIGKNYTGLDLVRKDIADRIVPCPVQCRPKNHKDWIYC